MSSGMKLQESIEKGKRYEKIKSRKTKYHSEIAAKWKKTLFSHCLLSSNLLKRVASMHVWEKREWKREKERERAERYKKQSHQLEIKEI